MKTKLLFAVCCFFISNKLLAQYETVIFNYDKSFFNEGKALPAEKKFMITGEISSAIQMVELKIFETSSITRKPVYETMWKRHSSNTRNTFTLPVNYALRGGDKYTLLINYYKVARPEMLDAMLEQLEESVYSYIDQSMMIEKNNLHVSKHPKMMLADMNSIVENGLYFYKNRINFEFTGLSDIVLDKLYQIRDLKLKKAKFNVFTRKEDDPENIKIKFAQEQIEALKTMVVKEIVQFANMNLLVVADSKKIVDYPTEKTKNMLAINLGYAGVYNEGSFDDFSSGSGAFAGISLPFGKAAFSSPFWSKTSISIGVFFENIKFSDENIASGPVVNRPLYLGLGYKALPFIRLNAGSAILQSPKDSGGLSDLDRVYLRPYVGLSVEFDLWIGLNK